MRDRFSKSSGSPGRWLVGLFAALMLLSGRAVRGQAVSSDPFADLEGSGSVVSASGTSVSNVSSGAAFLGSDPFADLVRSPQAAGKQMVAKVSTARRGNSRRTVTFLKKELFSQFTWEDGTGMPYSRQSVGGEILQRFSDSVRTWGSFNVQGRFVHRDNYLMPQNDAEGENRDQWYGEYHNLYFDLFNALDPFLSPEARRENIGRYNFRVGRFYLPSGINLQSDTHGTVLQLSNERNFGFERDWYTGLWGALNKDLNYDLYAMAGSGYDLRLEGQKGLLGLRVSLANRFLYDNGLEGGVSVISGERLSPHALMRSPSVVARADRGKHIETRRYGLDVRKTRPIQGGTLTSTGEWTIGRDEGDDVFTQLYQFDFLRRDRKLGLALQYRRFWQDIGPDPMVGGVGEMPGKRDASLVGEVTWYFRNDVGNSNLHWIKLNVERQTERQMGRPAVMTTLQYYRYW